ncbi:DUF397 domain-containing protein [Actinacidiphila oryziradicis]|jgi:hypothetical protein|uniref:DUF397 domain-containing protein n=1 Tax=Actinacidiphila oryziradicis TaxID=2571141 RepID=A0A4V5N0T8_9ACTN|nr:DUF397 domain-containing protein [Actinacidiphila oryziradicis]TKA13289.1 DUF397 domain-containing protein [Actinacidiphila oryziradicis]
MTHSPINWQKSSYSSGGDGNDCLELAATSGIIHLRESDAPDAVLIMSAKELRAFMRSLKAGEFDPGIAHDV